MIMKRLFSFFIIFCVIVLFCGCKSHSKLAQSTETIFLNSKYGCVQNDWEFQHEGQWYKANVPGNIHVDLLNNDLIPDPFFGTNEDSVQWVSDSVWCYRLQFDLNCADGASYKHRQLVFDGLDTYAEVSLNGKKLAAVDGTSRMDNMFRQWVFDLPEDVKEKGNVLEVRFLPSVPIDSVAAAAVPFKMPDTRVFTRKAQYESGWDWGPKLNTCGIWKNVYVRSWNDFRLDDVYVEDTKPTMDTNGIWLSKVNITTVADNKRRVKVTAEVLTPEGKQAFLIAKRVKLQPGENHIEIPVKIQHPQLWWPNGMGEQPLYQVNVRIEGTGQIAENRTPVMHGLRTVELKREKDAIGESFEFVVNGKSCFMRGADWIPASSYEGTLNTAEGSDVYYRLLHDAKEVNMNMLRVWGGGIYENDAFYNYCDQFGLLVWQDFMYACNPYPGDDHFMANARVEAIEQVKRLRNHACVALWCGNNEVHNGLEDWGWQSALNWSDKDNKQLYADFSKLFDKELPGVLHDLWSNVGYINSSPTFGWGHPECTTHGCSHYWGVWWGELPFEIWWEKTGRFMSEYGFQSYPEMATIEEFTTPSERKLNSPTMNNHQKHGRGVLIIRKAMEEDFGYTATDDLDEFAYVSQLVQAEGIVKAVDAHRSQHDKCKGTLTWQLNDCWPVASWSSIDYTGRWKALQYRFRESYANVAIAVHQNEDNAIDCYLINDALEDVKGEWKVKIMDMHGENLQELCSKTVIAKTNQSQKISTITPADAKGVSLNDAIVCIQFVVDGKVLAQKVTFFVKPKSLNLAKSDIQQEVKMFEDHFELTLSSPTFQYGVQIVETSGKQVKYSDNYFNLLPNEKKTIVGYYDVDGQGKPMLQIRSFHKR